MKEICAYLIEERCSHMGISTYSIPQDKEKVARYYITDVLLQHAENLGVDVFRAYFYTELSENYDIHNVQAAI